MGATTIGSGHGLRLVASMASTTRSVPVAVDDPVEAGTRPAVVAETDDERAPRPRRSSAIGTLSEVRPREVAHRHD